VQKPALHTGLFAGQSVSTEHVKVKSVHPPVQVLAAQSLQVLLTQKIFCGAAEFTGQLPLVAVHSSHAAGVCEVSQIGLLAAHGPLPPTHPEPKFPQHGAGGSLHNPFSQILHAADGENAFTNTGQKNGQSVVVVHGIGSQQPLLQELSIAQSLLVAHGRSQVLT
jgi:hypothetical protein